ISMQRKYGWQAGKSGDQPGFTLGALPMNDVRWVQAEMPQEGEGSGEKRATHAGHGKRAIGNRNEVEVAFATVFTGFRPLFTVDDFEFEIGLVFQSFQQVVDGW